MMFPPSLPAEVHQRAFVASNGELGIFPTDAKAFLDACRKDGVSVYGWELWLVDGATGRWNGLIPTRRPKKTAVFGGEGNVDETERQLALVDIGSEIAPEAIPDVRVNFTL